MKLLHQVNERRYFVAFSVKDLPETPSKLSHR